MQPPALPRVRPVDVGVQVRDHRLDVPGVEGGVEVSDQVFVHAAIIRNREVAGSARTLSARPRRARAHRGGVLAQRPAQPCPTPPRLSTSRSASSSSARRKASGSRRRDVGDQPVGGERRHPQAAPHLRRGLAGGERLGDRERVADAADHLVEQARDPLALLAQLQQRAGGGLLVAGHERVGERPGAALGGAGARRLAPPRRRCARRRRARSRASRARAAAAGGARRPGRRARGRPGRRARRRARRPGRRASAGARGPSAPSRRRSARRRPRPPCAAPSGALARPSSRAKNATVSVSGSMRSMAAATGADVGLLPALDAVGDHEPPPDRERHRRQRGRDRVGGARVRLEQLDAVLAALRLRHRAQPRAALADAAVVVAVDEVRGLEAGHGRSRLDAATAHRSGALDAHPAAADAQADRAVAVRAEHVIDRAQRRQRRRRRVSVGVAAADLDRRERRVAAARAGPGRPSSALPWWATFSASTCGSGRAAVTFDSASAGSSRSKSPDRTSATIARSLGSPSGRNPGPGGGGHSSRIRIEPSSSTWPAWAEIRRACAGGGRGRKPALDRRRPAGAAVRPPAASGCARRTASAAPSWSVWACVSTSASSRLDARLGEPAQDRAVRRPGVDEHGRAVRLEQRRVALADVEERHHELARAPAGRPCRRPRPRRARAPAPRRARPRPRRAGPDAARPPPSAPGRRAARPGATRPARRHRARERGVGRRRAPPASAGAPAAPPPGRRPSCARPTRRTRAAARSRR